MVTATVYGMESLSWESIAKNSPEVAIRDFHELRLEG